MTSPASPTSEAARAIEAILMVAQEPVEPHLLAQLLELAPIKVEEVCAELSAEYERDERGFVLVRVAGGYRYQSHTDLAPYVERFVLEGQSARLSSAALETLAIVAYKQPISRAQVAAIRGVGVDGVMRTLQQRGYIAEVARDQGPGQAVLFGTTVEFLERLGLDTLDDLPPIAAFVPGADVVEALEQSLRPDASEAPGSADSADLSDAVAGADAVDRALVESQDPGSDAADRFDGVDLSDQVDGADAVGRAPVESQDPGPDAADRSDGLGALGEAAVGSEDA